MAICYHLTVCSTLVIIHGIVAVGCSSSDATAGHGSSGGASSSWVTGGGVNATTGGRSAAGGRPTSAGVGTVVGVGGVLGLSGATTGLGGIASGASNAGRTSGEASRGGASGIGSSSPETGTGGRTTTGGAFGKGGATGSSATGGSATGGSATGGSATGGSATGGSATGGSATGGSVTDGSSQSPCLGWAAVAAEGVTRTTGGEGGPVIEITTAAQLTSYRRDTAPKILHIMNDLTGEFELGPNKTVEGANANVTIHGSLSFSGTATAVLSNLIVRNLRINAVTSSEDGMDIRWAHHVCVEHCEFIDAPDGNLDIVSEANYVTVAYNKFRYTASYQPLPREATLNHRFANLVGSSNTTELDRGKLKVTFHHNWWAEGVVERMPRVRFGDVHVFNNYYSAAGNDYAVAAGREAKLVIENNYFENVNDPHIFYDGDLTAQIVARGNEYVNTTGLRHSGQGSSFVPPYVYALEPAASVKANVVTNAGPK